MLVEAGLHFDDSRVPADHNNQKGYYEDADVLALNRKMLRACFSSDFDICNSICMIPSIRHLPGVLLMRIVFLHLAPSFISNQSLPLYALESAGSRTSDAPA